MLNFGQALEALKEGKRITRKGWNGQGMFVYYVPPASYPAQTEAAKQTFGDSVPYRAYLALKTAQNDIATWNPSTSDVLAEDWEVVEVRKKYRKKVQIEVVGIDQEGYIVQNVGDPQDRWVINPDKFDNTYELVDK